ncbi:hypothetical protein [Microbacterium sp. YY-01]|uniref:hypothetical protein n=1 Tax=Microbacterium sp. YY-01 TaxID=3421634 RepID=UPI003D17FC48
MEHNWIMDGYFRLVQRPQRLRNLEGLSESGLFAAAVSVMLGWRETFPFQAAVERQFGGDPVSHFTMKVDPGLMRYELHNLDTGDFETYDGWAHEKIFNGKPQACSVRSVSPEAFVTRLAFPTSLGVWGRPGDNYTLTGGATIEGDLIRLDLVHITEKALQGALYVSAPLSMAVKMDTPNISVSYNSICWI